MLLDMRTYTCRPGTIKLQLELYEKHGFGPQKRYSGDVVELYVNFTVRALSTHATPSTSGGIIVPQSAPSATSFIRWRSAPSFIVLPGKPMPLIVTSILPPTMLVVAVSAHGWS